MVRTVAIVLERANVTLRGAEHSMFELAQSLSAGDLEVHLLAGQGRTKLRNIHVLCPSASAQPGLSDFGRALRQHLAENHYDIVHSVLPFDFVDLYQPQDGTRAELTRRHVAACSYPGVRLARRIRARVNRRHKELLQAERRLCRSENGPALIALSKYVADQLQHHYRTDPARIVLAPGGVRTDRRADMRTADRLRMQMLAELGLDAKDEPVLFLFVAHDFRLKGLDRLIRAFHLVVTRQAETCPYLIVVGADRSNRYRHLARRLGIERRIVFLGPIRRLCNILSIVNVGVLPTFYDPCNRFTLDALAAGKPMITTRFNGAADQFTDGRHGRILDSPENVAALAEAILRFTAPAALRQASQAILDDGLAQNISVRRLARDLLALYESIHERKRYS